MDKLIRQYWVCVGKMASLFGTRGHILSMSFTHEPMSLFRYHPLVAGSSCANDDDLYHKTVICIKCLGWHTRSGRTYIQTEIQNITTRELALPFKGLSLYTQKNTIREFSNKQTEDEDAFFYMDLIGLDLFDVHNNDTWIGRVVDVKEFRENVLVEISNNKENKYLVPFTKENFPYISISKRFGYINDATNFSSIV